MTYRSNAPQDESSPAVTSGWYKLKHPDYGEVEAKDLSCEVLDITVFKFYVPSVNIWYVGMQRRYSKNTFPLLESGNTPEIALLKLKRIMFLFAKEFFQ